jgi:hypothetical protein
MTYGGVDRSAAGRWAAKDGAVVLTSDVPPPPTLKFGGRKPKLLSRYAAEPDKPTLLSVQVTSPNRGLVWSNMVITAQFSNGKSRSGTTGRSGEIGFLQREDEDWKGAVVRRVSAAYPKADVAPVWTEVDSQRDKTIVFHFEPGTLAQPAFQTLSFKVKRGENGGVALVEQAADSPAEAVGRFVRR